MKADTEPEQSINYINEISHKSNHMIVAMDDMLWSLDPANDSLIKIIERAKEFASSVGYARNIVIDVKSDASVIKLKPDMKLRHKLWFIYKTALQLLAEEADTFHIAVQFGIVKQELQLAFFAEGDGQKPYRKLLTL